MLKVSCSHAAFITQKRLDLISHLTSRVSKTVGSIATDVANATADIRSIRLEQEGIVRNTPSFHSIRAEKPHIRKQRSGYLRLANTSHNDFSKQTPREPLNQSPPRQWRSATATARTIQVMDDFDWHYPVVHWFA
jgi:hypothetical protein